MAIDIKRRPIGEKNSTVLDGKVCFVRITDPNLSVKQTLESTMTQQGQVFVAQDQSV